MLNEGNPSVSDQNITFYLNFRIPISCKINGMMRKRPTAWLAAHCDMSVSVSIVTDHSADVFKRVRQSLR